MRCQQTNLQFSELPDCLPSVKNVHEWDRENVRLLGSGKVGNVSVEWDTLLSIRQENDCEHVLWLTFSAAPALATAKETPRIALAPNLPLFGVPSRLIKNSSILDWSLTSMFSLIRAGPMISLTLATALVTPFPAHLSLSPSRSSTASCWPEVPFGQPCGFLAFGAIYVPVEAPDGTMARWRPVSVTTSTSTVGFPRES